MKKTAPVLAVFATIMCNGPVQAGAGTDFNFGWKFELDAPEAANRADFDDADWRTVDLPHDWVIEGEPDPNLDFWQATGRLPGAGIGWYRKRFTIDELDDRSVQIVFDGVYNKSDTWINGHHLGFHPYGYSPFHYDLTPYLVEGENIIAVKVDHRAYADSRWYTGAGIYRNVRLFDTSKAHIPVWGVYITTPTVSSQSATVDAQVEIRNDFKRKKELTLKAAILDPKGRTVARREISLRLQANSGDVQNVQMNVDNPELWGVDTPNLYTLVTTLRGNGAELDRRETRFGIRTIRFDTDEGFFLNGVNMKIKGVNLHHDGGLVGAAVPKDVWRRRFEILRQGGANAIRSAHNPPSEEFLDLADEMGFLVQNEFFDDWDYPKDKRFNKWETEVHPETQGYTEYFQEWAERDLKAVMLRDRNHPSIIQWSIGNEIEWVYPRTQEATGFFDLDWKGNYFFSEPPLSPAQIKERLDTLPRHEYDIGTTAKKLATWTRELDLTRPVTANMILPSSSHLSGYADALDVIGYSYRRVLYDYGHKHYPDKPIMGTENLPQYHEWKAVMDRDHIAGTFLWTGIRHLGEVRGEWPVNTSSAGLLDLAGFRDWGWHMYRSLWREEPHLILATNRPGDILFGNAPRYRITDDGDVVETEPGTWERLLWSWWPMNPHWNYNDGETIVVEAYSNADEIELFLNDESLGRKKLSDFEDHVCKWAVPFAPGELRAQGWKDGEPVEYILGTHSKPTRIQTNFDQAQLAADGYSVAHIEIQLVDSDGRPAILHDRELRFNVPDGLKRLGVDNGSPTNVQKYQADSLVTHQGRALLVVQSRKKPGTYRIGIKGKDLETASIVLVVD